MALVPGAYERLLSSGLRDELAALPADFRKRLSQLDPGDAHELLARYVHDRLLSALQNLARGAEDARPDQLALCNLLIEAIGTVSDTGSTSDQLSPPGEVLQSLFCERLGAQEPRPPHFGLSTSTLILNDRETVGLSAVLDRELESADSVDLICAFVNHTGVRILRDRIGEVCRRGGMRLVTTTYMQATQRRALDELADLGVQVKVAYETPPARTKLHAKAWLMKRRTGYDTALIGSSNLSHSALMEGLEWNVRLTHVDAPHVLRRFQTTFDRYWQDPTFEDYDPTRDRERLDLALQAGSNESRIQIANIEVTPRPHQVQILESLDADRDRGKYRSLVVAATGTGKTVVAGLDYRRLRRQEGDLSLLFVAHRHEILDQSARTFRQILRDGGFGEDWSNGVKPEKWRHVFASIQTIASHGARRLAADQFDMVIIDEIHHAMAATYQDLLEHLRPRYLLGLTATPERTDGRSVAELFEGASTTEMRLWDALDEGILCPFQYFAINDDISLEDVAWEGGKYRVAELEDKYTRRGEARTALVLENIQRIVEDWTRMRALGYCVSKRHAQYMAEQFRNADVRAAHVTADTPAQEREQALRQLAAGQLQVLFAVDLFNEGVDIPEVDTVLFLRPTESATVFIQQLGRGLRLCEGKRCLTALDFVGHHNTRFRFDKRLRAMTGGSLMSVRGQVEQGFTHLPLGCSITLDEIARRNVLANLRACLPSNTRQMAQELRALASGQADYPLASYLRETGLEYDDLYRPKRTYTTLKRDAGLLPASPSNTELSLQSGVSRLIHMDDSERLSFYSRLLSRAKLPDSADLTLREQRMLFMLLYTLDREARPDAMGSALQSLWDESALRGEIVELCDGLNDQRHSVTYRLEAPALEDVPLRAHGTYTRDEVIAAMGVANPASVREGVRWIPEHRTDVLFVTLRKTEAEYSITTLYDDYVISPTEFHWESQGRTTPTSPAGKRYISHAEQGSHVLLCVREGRQLDSLTAPYLCAGLVRYVRHESEKPMRVVWQLDRPLPAALYPALKAAAG